ncbi:ABC transporter permease [Acidaminococcus intestini]|nr:ABC transporter permease [Acidaminococcus intestini]
MLLGNAMNSVSLGIKTFRETLVGQQARMEALACLGADSGDILQPFVIRALETAMVPTLNSMVGMGIVSLPGMMTGQILAGAPPLLAILYQISIMIAIASVVTLTSFASLYAGARTLYDKKTQMIRLPETKGH